MVDVRRARLGCRGCGQRRGQGAGNRGWPLGLASGGHQYLNMLQWKVERTGVGLGQGLHTGPHTLLSFPSPSPIWQGPGFRHQGLPAGSEAPLPPWG